MKKVLILIALVAATAAATSPVKKNQDGTVTIDTSSLKTVEGCFGPTPLIIHLDAQGVVSEIEALPNDETPAYWQMAVDGLKKIFIGVEADKVDNLEVDAVSGATYSSEGFISNVKAGISVYLEAEGSNTVK